MMKKIETNTSIKIVPKSATDYLHKEQIAFNKLTEKIEYLKKLNQKKTDIADAVLASYYELIKPSEAKKAESLINCAIELDYYLSQNKKLQKKDAKEIKSIIITLMQQSFSIAEPNDEAITIFNKYNENTYEDEVESEKENEKEFLLYQLNSNFGNHFTMADLEDTPEANEKLMQKIKFHEEKQEQKEKVKEQKREKKLEEKLKNEPPKKQTKQQQKQEKKQAERLAQEKEEQAVQQKSIRSIYLDLVKVLHPDTEMNEDEKLWKQELMKEVTVAYNDKNLIKLLDLEMAWLSKQGNYLASISLDKIKIFNNVLRKQVMELEHKGFLIYRNPRYSEVTNFFGITVASALKKVEGRKIEYDKELNLLKHIALTINRNKFKTAKNMISYLGDHFDLHDDDDDDEDAFFKMLFGNNSFGGW